MAVLEKKYTCKSVILLNIVYDIAEMHKAKVTRLDRERLLIDTEMYGIRTEYVFRIAPLPTGTLVSVATECQDASADRLIQLMFAILENMLSAFT